MKRVTRFMAAFAVTALAGGIIVVAMIVRCLFNPPVNEPLDYGDDDPGTDLDN